MSDLDTRTLLLLGIAEYASASGFDGVTKGEVTVDANTLKKS